MLRKGRFKLCLYADDTCELFDLENDALELKNLYGTPEYAKVQTDLTLALAKRLLSVKVRDYKEIKWDFEAYPVDVRFEPLENRA